MNFVGIDLILFANLFLQNQLSYSPLKAGISSLPLFIPLCLMSPLTGKIVAKFGTKLPMLVGIILGFIGSILPLLFLNTEISYQSMICLLIFTGLCMGLLTPAVVTCCISACENRIQGLASGINNASRQAGGAIGIAVYGMDL